MASTSTAHVPPSGPPEGQGPLRIGAYHIPTAEEQIISWQEICQIIATGDLGDLYRNQACEDAYRTWREPIKKYYGSLEEYVRQHRLEWQDSGPGAESTPGLEFFRPEWGLDRVKCIPNDWPYGIPGDCGHYVVWSKSPMLHPLLFQSDDTPFDAGERAEIYEAVVEDGVRGLTGNPSGLHVLGMNTVKILKDKPSVAVGQKDDDAASSKAERAHWWAGRHVRAYVLKRWPEDQWETAWFCNPPHLRTVPGLSHFQYVLSGLAHIGNCAF